MMVYECSPKTVFDDNNLPEGVCGEISHKTAMCMVYVAAGWATGDDYVRCVN